MIPKHRIKQANSDFIVNEVFITPFLQEAEESKYTYIIGRKEGYTSFKMMDILAEISSLQNDNIKVTGLKDEEGITTQMLQIEKILTTKDLKSYNQELNDRNIEIELMSVLGYGNQSLHPAMLHGNVFTIIIRDLHHGFAQKLENFINDLKYFSFINYYDEQRFGTPGSIHNTDKIGEALHDQKWEEAYTHFLESKNDPDDTRKVLETHKDTQSYKDALFTLPKGMRDFFIKSYYSRLWNAEVSDMISKSQHVSAEELPYLGSLNFPGKNDFEAPAILSTSAHSMNWETLTTTKYVSTRPLTVITSVFCRRIMKDTLNTGQYAADITFFLPTGSYATMLIKQLLLKAAQS